MDSTLQDIYLSSIVHKCGSWIPVSEAPGLVNDDKTVDYLLNLGIKRYSKFSDSLYNLAISSLEKVIAKANCDPRDIDATVFFSTTYDPYTQDTQVASALYELGLSHAIPYGVFHNQCTNYSQALQLAKMLCKAKEAENVLIFGYDSMDDVRSSRVMPQKTSVYSDVFVGFLLTTNRNIADYRLEAIEHTFTPEIIKYDDPKDVLRYLMVYSDSFKNACNCLYDNNRLEQSNFNGIITANYNFSVVRNLIELAGFEFNKLFTGNISRYSHCFSADQLISLQTLLENNEATEGSRYLLTAVGGLVVFSAISVVKV